MSTAPDLLFLKKVPAAQGTLEFLGCCSTFLSFLGRYSWADFPFYGKMKTGSSFLTKLFAFIATRQRPTKHRLALEPLPHPIYERLTNLSQFIMVHLLVLINGETCPHQPSTLAMVGSAAMAIVFCPRMLGCPAQP